MYVVIEGVDGVGKTTQISLLKSIYKDAIFTQEPSDTKFGQDIRKLALDIEVNNKTQALLFMADRAMHTENILLKNKNKLIISDRSLISGIAYGVDFHYEELKNINLQIAPLPNIVIVLITNKDILEDRFRKKQLDNIENKGVEFLLKIQNKIIEITKDLNIETLYIDCNEDKNKILKKITDKINNEMFDM